MKKSIIFPVCPIDIQDGALRNAENGSCHDAVSQRDKGLIFLGKIFLILFLQLTSFNLAHAEIIDIQKEEKKFGDWKVYCETDVMMDNSHCKIASKFFDSSSAITIEPTPKFYNQLFIVLPQVRVGTFVTIRVDHNDLIFSDNAKANDFGLIQLDDTKKTEFYRQLKTGDFLFLRFNVKASEKEVTAKINLKDFRSALSYYNSRVSK